MHIQDKKFAFWLKIAALVGILTYVTYATTRQPFNWAVIQQALGRTDHPVGWGLLLILLMPLNWGFEALKWQVLVRRVERVSFAAAYRGILAGLALGMAIPTGVGDTVGRVLSLQTRRRADSIGAALVSGGMQFYVAIVMGALAWTVHLMQVPERNSPTAQMLAIGLWVLTGLGILLALIRRSLLAPGRWQWNGRWRFVGRYEHYWTVAGAYSGVEMLAAFGAATLRYLTFSAQFLLVLHLYNLSLPAPDLLAGVGLVFLVKTITPAFNWLSDLGVREAAALWVFQPYHWPAPVLVAATLTLWVINVLVPVLIGLAGVWRLRLSGTHAA